MPQTGGVKRLSETNAETSSGSALNPADNPERWIEARIKRDAEPTSDTGQSEQQASPAQPTVAAESPSVQPTSWRDTVIGDDVDHGFFKGKKVADAIESYKHAERAKQEAERQRNEIARQYEQLQREREAELAARRVYAEQQQPAATQTDPYSEIESLWFENPKAAAAKLREATLSEARQIAEEALQGFKQETKTKEVTSRAENNFEVVRSMLNLGDGDWNLDPSTPGGRKGLAVYSLITNPNTHYAQQGGPLDARVVAQAYVDLFGDPRAQSTPVAPVAPLAPPPISTPPGASKPAKATVPSASVSPLADEDARTAKLLAGYAGIDSEGLMKRMARRG